jgi:hypothetical protein
MFWEVNRLNKKPRKYILILRRFQHSLLEMVVLTLTISVEKVFLTMKVGGTLQVRVKAARTRKELNIY